MDHKSRPLLELYVEGVQGLDENTAQSAVESAIDALKGSYPELADAKKAIVRYEL